MEEYGTPDKFNVDGRPLTERECFAHLVDCLGRACDAARGLGHLRKDMRWIAVSGVLQEVRDRATLILHKPKGISIPASARGH